MRLLTRALRRTLVGPDRDFVFRPPPDGFAPPRLGASSLYLHVPFCRTLCPYCPYNRIQLRQELLAPYRDALLAELARLRRQLGERISISSVYVGGGTPTTMLPHLGEVLEAVRSSFSVDGPICVETTPLDLDRDAARALRSAGVDLLSVGVQSFDDESLRLIGRPYRAERAREALAAAAEAGFQSVNCDLMFALPGQRDESLRRDLDTAVALGAGQITAYPLFTFPYSSVGTYRRLRKVRMPPLGARRRMYDLLSRRLAAAGFERASVWGFTRGGAPRYSSVTRDDYYGLGAGAGTHAGGWYSLNTFSVPAYVERCLRGESPAALAVPFSEAMTRYHWLYWRLYDTRVDRGEFERRFAGDRRARALLSLIRWMRLAEETGGELRLNQRGAFWVHLAQNLFSLRYIDTIWSEARREAWPRAIPF